ncbi:Phosphoglycerate mutase-like protein [Mycena kentingensis (nom. inval.)]|nr:Phosphoglycerate mutase-like protein [Mycena kentingensis (nom. inval.)]
MLLTRFLLLLPTAAYAFDPLHHSGPASPYFDAPTQDGIPHDMPAGCIVDQAAYILRHGARYPEPGSFAGWQNLFAKLQNAKYTAKGPLAFLPSWRVPVDDVPHQPLYLTAAGALEAFALGVDLRKRYQLTKGGDNITVWSAGQQRCVDTATFFARGYLSQGNYLSEPSANRANIIVLPDSVNYTFANSLTPSAGCPQYASGDTSSVAGTFRLSYQPRIAARLNKFLDGLQLNATDIGVMMDLCGFQTAVNGDTRFCGLFEESEWRLYEYAHDLNYYYGSGPGNPFSATVGFPWVSAVAELFSLGPGKTTPGGNITPPPLVMGFTHDNNLPPILSALGLWNTSSERGVYPLSLTKPNEKRKFRSSNVVAFRGYVALERMACSSVEDVQNNGTTHLFVRVRVDRAPVEIPGCASGPGSTCPLQQFTEYVHKTRARAAGDFVDKCGLSSVANSTSHATFFTIAPPDMDEVVVGLN